MTGTAGPRQLQQVKEDTTKTKAPQSRCLSRAMGPCFVAGPAGLRIVLEAIIPRGMDLPCICPHLRWACMRSALVGVSLYLPCVCPHLPWACMRAAPVGVAMELTCICPGMAMALPGNARAIPGQFHDSPMATPVGTERMPMANAGWQMYGKSMPAQRKCP